MANISLSRVVIFFTCSVVAVQAAECSRLYIPASPDSLAALQIVKDRSIAYMLGGSGQGPYRKEVLHETDSWVESVLQKKMQTLSWDENAAEIMNQRLVGLASELHRLAIAYRADGSRFEGSGKVKEWIFANLENILEHYSPGSPRPGNWYQWLISLPHHLGAIALLMEDQMPAAILERLKQTLRNELSPELILTGTNASWEARNHIYLALLDGDLKRLERAADYVFRSVRFGPRQGIREDYCYLFHGHIPYAGGYGAGFAQTVTEFIYVFEGTPWSIKPVHREIIRNLLLEHTRWFLADGKVDLHVRGRSYKEGNASWNLVLKALLVLSQTDDPRRQEIIETVAAMIKSHPDIDLDLTAAGFADRLPSAEAKLPLGFRYWPSGEIGVFRQPGYHVSFRQFSERVQDYEYLMRQDGGEGGEGWNLPYGFTNIQRNDRANNWYQTADGSGRMLPEIDFRHLPGTTTRFGTEPENPPFRHDPNVPTMSTTGFSLNFGKSNFAGGVGWHEGGVAGFVLEPVHGEFTAKKSLHFFPGGYWALGSDIRSVNPPVENANRPVHTTVLQWVSEKAEPILKLGGKSVQLKKDSINVFSKAKWFWIEDERVAVVFHAPTDFSVRLKGKAITVWLDHGVNPLSARYAYAVLPDVSLEETISFERTRPFALVRHDEKVHAVADASRNHAGIVFFEGGACLDISSQGPALVFRTKDSNGGVLTVQDPLHENRKLRLSIAGVQGHVTSPDEAVSATKNSQGQLGVEVSSVLGRIYRLAYGAAGSTVEGVPRKDLHLSSYEDFKVEADRDPDKTIITVRLPADAIDNEYKLSVHFSKSQRLHDFTEKDVMDRPSRNTVRYRWERHPAVGPPVFSEYLKLLHGNFKVMLVTELLSVEDDIKVPAFKSR